MNLTIKCSKCRQEKPLTDYYKGQHRCKVCQEAYYQENKEHINKRKREYYHANKKKLLECQKKYQKANPEKMKKWNHDYYMRHKKRINEKARIRHHENRDEYNEYQRKYYHAHKKLVGRPKKKEPKSKKCTKCKALKTIDQYYTRKDNKDGYQTKCKDCWNEYHRVKAKMYYRNHKETYRERHKRYRDKLDELAKIYHEEAPGIAFSEWRRRRNEKVY